LSEQKKSDSPDSEITRRRDAIDALDARLVEVLAERARLAAEIGALKGDGPVYRPDREAEVLRRVAQLNPGPLPREAIERIFTEVISACRGMEAKLAVSYLGPSGTFTEMALLQRFGRGVDAVPCATLDEVVRTAESGAAGYAVVPVENSTEGAVGRTLDLLVQTPLKICSEVVVRVRQNLMSRATPQDAITKVYSHAQSLGQCNGWLGQHLPHADRIAVASNAEAARLAAGEPGAAAIGPEIAAERYGLEILARSIEDDARNRTRFLVLGRDEPRATGRDRTSLVMSAHNRPGAVHELLTPFAKYDVSMSKIESRPARTGQWEYLFFVDVDGHQSDEKVARALAELKGMAPFLKIFGSYPMAEL